MASTTYLVDFENVHDAGLHGIQKLPSGETVYLFYTEHADRISLDMLSGISVLFHPIKIPYGKQSLDMHLVSYIGYLIGRETDPESRYVIVSNDSDFNGVTRFWCTRFGMEDKVSVRSELLPDEGPFSESAMEYLGTLMAKLVHASGEDTPEGIRRLSMSSLCTRLNVDRTYLAERKRSGMKALRFLEEFRDYISLRRLDGIDWIYEKTESSPEGDGEGAEAAAIPAQEPAALPQGGAARTEKGPSKRRTQKNRHSSRKGKGRPVQDTWDESWLADDDAGEPFVPEEETVPQEEEEADPAAPDVPPAPADNLYAFLETVLDEPDDILETVRILMENAFTQTGKMQIYNAMTRAFGVRKGRALYNAVKGCMPSYDPTHDYRTENATVLDNDQMDELPF